MKKISSIFSILFPLIIIYIYLFMNGKRTTPMDELYLASALYFLCILPFFLYFYLQEKNIPYVALFGLTYFAYYGLGIFHEYDVYTFQQVNPHVIYRTLLIIFFGFVSFIFAFYSSKLPVERIVPHINIAFDTTKIWPWGARLTLIGLVTHYYTTQEKSVPLIFGSMVTFLDQLTLMGMGVLFLTQLKGKLKLWPKLMLWCFAMPIRFIFTLSTGGFSTIIYETAVFIFIYLYCRQRIPWLLIILLAFPYSLIWGARDEYRDRAWLGDYRGKNAFERGFMYLGLIGKGFHQTVSNDDTEFLGSAYSRLSARSNQFVTFAKVVELTPDYIPFWGGFTYRNLLLSPLPRILFPDKPIKNLGQDFGHRYGFLDPGDMGTSYNLPFTVEMYINFGPWAVVVGMFIIGIIVRIIYALFNHPLCGEGGFLICAVIFVAILNLESDFSLLFGAMIQQLFLFYIIMKRLKLKVERIS